MKSTRGDHLETMKNNVKDKWSHIVEKGKSMLGRVYLIAAEMANRKYPQHRKGSLEDHIEVAKKLPLSERYIRGSLKQTQTALQVCWRSLNNRIRNYIEQKSKVPQYLSGLRKKKRNGK